MKNLCIVFLLILSACSTVKKAITSTHVKSDSVQVMHKDSTTTHSTENSDDYLNIGNADIVIDYGKDSTKPVDTFSNRQIQALHDVVRAVSANRIPRRIVIHIGTLSDSSHLAETSDSSAFQQNDTTRVKKNIITDTRNVSKKSSPIAITIGLIVLGLAVIAFVILKIINKL